MTEGHHAGGSAETGAKASGGGRAVASGVPEMGGGQRKGLLLLDTNNVTEHQPQRRPQCPRWLKRGVRPLHNHV